jgi:hypothetical protein
MTDKEQTILTALLELESAVAAMATVSPKPDLRPLFARVDQLARELPKGADPDLVHYLQRKSYHKARLFLQGRDAENAEGSCH